MRIMLIVAAAVLVMWLSSGVRAAETQAETWDIRAQELSRDAIIKAKVLKEERIEVPTDAGTFQGPAWIPNADRDGYVLLFVFFNYGIVFDDSQAVAIDTMSGKTAKFTIPKGLNISLALERGVFDAQGRFYCFFRCRGIGEVWRFDPAKMNFARLGTPLFKRGRGYGRLASREGRIWGTVNSGGDVGVYCYDPKAEKFRSYGFVSPKQTRGGETRGYSVTAVGDYAYVAVGKVPWRLVAVNLKTGKGEIILEAPAGNSQIWVREDYAIRRPDPNDHTKMEMYELKDGKATLADAEWTFGKRNERRKARGGPRPKPLPRPKVDTTQATPTGEGKSVVRYQLPGAEEWQAVEVKVKTYPQAIRRLVALPDGRLFGSIGSYKGGFLYDPKTGESERTPTCQLSQYGTLVHDGKVWASGYPSSPVYVYNPAKPLMAAPSAKQADHPDANPRLVTFLKDSWAHKMWGAAVGSDGKVYFCGEVARQGNGGALGWWDPKEKKAGALSWKTFAGQKTLYAASAKGGDVIVLNAHVTINNITGKVPETAKMFVYDVRAGRIASVEPIKGAKMLGPVVEVMPGKVLSVASMGGYREADSDSILFGFDVDAMKVVFTKKLPVPLAAWNHGMRGGQEFPLGPDGFVWTHLGQTRSPHMPTLVRINPKTAEIVVVGRVVKRGPLAFAGKDLYRGCEHKSGRLRLRRLANIVP